MRWLGIDKGHHELSHEPDSNEDAYEKLIKINTWYCEQVALLGQALAATQSLAAKAPCGQHHFGLDQ